jgi:hypothetical protein
MDYGKSGNPKAAKNNPRTPDFGKKGAPASVKPPREAPAALLARMKAAAAAKTPK